MKRSQGHCCFFRIAQADKSKPLGALLIGDHLYISDSAAGAEEAGKVRLTEDEGQVGDVKTAGKTFVNLPRASLLLWVGDEDLTGIVRLLLVHVFSAVNGQVVRQRLKIGRWLGGDDAVVGEG